MTNKNPIKKFTCWGGVRLYEEYFGNEEIKITADNRVYIDGEFVTRVMLPLSLSYDHRLIDGAEAARFNNDLKENLGKNFAYRLAV